MLLVILRIVHNKGWQLFGTKNVFCISISICIFNCIATNKQTFNRKNQKDTKPMTGSIRVMIIQVDPVNRVCLDPDLDPGLVEAVSSLQKSYELPNLLIARITTVRRAARSCFNSNES